MVYVIAASSLRRALGNLNNADRQPVNDFVIGILSLSINPFVKNNIRLSYHLEHGLLKEKFNIVIWHDAINNSLTAHHPNNFNSITPKQLLPFY